MVFHYHESSREIFESAPKIIMRYLYAFFCFAVCAFADKPNVILIYVDDMGYGDASCLNSKSKFKTPNIDRLAREGRTFTDGHSPDTVCTPSRYGLLTGRYSWRTTLKRGVMGAEGACLIAEGRLTLADALVPSGKLKTPAFSTCLQNALKSCRYWGDKALNGALDVPTSLYFESWAK